MFPCQMIIILEYMLTGANDIVDNDAWQHHSCKKCVENEWSGNAKGLGLKTIEPITKEERSSK